MNWMCNEQRTEPSFPFFNSYPKLSISHLSFTMFPFTIHILHFYIGDGEVRRWKKKSIDWYWMFGVWESLFSIESSKCKISQQSIRKVCSCVCRCERCMLLHWLIWQCSQNIHCFTMHIHRIYILVQYLLK